jgi:hypothetical protein
MGGTVNNSRHYYNSSNRSNKYTNRNCNSNSRRHNKGDIINVTKAAARNLF